MGQQRNTDGYGKSDQTESLKPWKRQPVSLATLPYRRFVPPLFFGFNNRIRFSACVEISKVFRFPKMQQECEQRKATTLAVQGPGGGDPFKRFPLGLL